MARALPASPAPNSIGSAPTINSSASQASVSSIKKLFDEFEKRLSNLELITSGQIQPQLAKLEDTSKALEAYMWGGLSESGLGAPGCWSGMAGAMPAAGLADGSQCLLQADDVVSQIGLCCVPTAERTRALVTPYPAVPSYPQGALNSYDEIAMHTPPAADMRFSMKQQVGRSMEEIEGRVSSRIAQMVDKKTDEHMVVLERLLRKYEHVGTPTNGDAAANPEIKLEVSPMGALSQAMASSPDNVKESKDDTEQLPMEHDVTYSELLKHANMETTYKMKESLWDASAFVGNIAIGNGGSAVIFTALVLNMIVQLTFSLIVWRSFLDYPFEQYPYTTYHTWRQTDGHSFLQMDPFTRQSLVSRVCNMDETLSVATSQLDIISAIADYTKPFLFAFSSGVVLCIMCIFLFSLAIFREIDTTISFLKTMTQVSGPADTHVHCDHEGYTLVNMSYGRLTFVYGFTAVRVAIAIILLVCGSLWLANETSIQELVLNAAALEFVLNVDEVFYAAFCPKVSRSLLENMKPITLKLSKTISGVGMQLFVFTTFMFAFVSIVGVLRVIPLEGDMLAIKDIMCLGKLDFVIGMQVSTGQLYAGPTGHEGDVVQGVAMKAVQEVLDRGVYAESALEGNSYASYSKQWSLTEGTINAPWSDNVAQAPPRCLDSNLENEAPRLAAIRSMTELATGKTCADFKSHCSSFTSGSLVRFLCPNLCKCGMPRAGLYLDGPIFGCARESCRKHDRVQEALGKLPCKDEAVNTLKNDASWIAYWNQYLDFWGNSTPFYAQTHNSALTHGCNFKDILHVCEETDAMASVRTFCPMTCGCRNEMHTDCPTACSTYSRPIIADQVQQLILQGLITVPNSTAR